MDNEFGNLIGWDGPGTPRFAHRQLSAIPVHSRELGDWPTVVRFDGTEF